MFRGLEDACQQVAIDMEEKLLELSAKLSGRESQLESVKARMREFETIAKLQRNSERVIMLFSLTSPPP